MTPEGGQQLFIDKSGSEIRHQAQALYLLVEGEEPKSLRLAHLTFQGFAFEGRICRYVSLL